MPFTYSTNVFLEQGVDLLVSNQLFVGGTTNLQNNSLINLASGVNRNDAATMGQLPGPTVSNPTTKAGFTTPTSVFGTTSSTVLGIPTAFIQVVVNGVTFSVPGY